MNIFPVSTSLFHSRTYPGFSSAQQWDYLGNTNHILPLASAVVFDKDGQGWLGGWGTSPHMPSFCGGASFVYPQTYLLTKTDAPDHVMDNAVPAGMGPSAALLAAMVGVMKHYGRYVGFTSGPSKYGNYATQIQSIEELMASSDGDVQVHASVGVRIHENLSADVLSLKGVRADTRAQWCIVEMERCRKMKNPNSGNECYAVNFYIAKCSVALERYVDSTEAAVSAHRSWFRKKVYPQLRNRVGLPLLPRIPGVNEKESEQSIEW